jgi:hypothetical protein
MSKRIRTPSQRGPSYSSALYQYRLVYRVLPSQNPKILKMPALLRETNTGASPSPPTTIFSWPGGLRVWVSLLSAQLIPGQLRGTRVRLRG